MTPAVSTFVQFSSMIWSNGARRSVCVGTVYGAVRSDKDADVCSGTGKHVEVLAYRNDLDLAARRALLRLRAVYPGPDAERGRDGDKRVLFHDRFIPIRAR